MTRNIARYTLCISLLFVGSLMLHGPTSTINGMNTPQNQAPTQALTATQACDVIKAFFSTNKNRPSIDQLLNALGYYDASFLEFLNIADPQTEDIVAHILLKLELFPLEIQDHLRPFTSRSGENESLASLVNEGKMFDELKNLVASQPQKPILHWPQLVDRITILVEGNKKYIVFVVKLRGYRNWTGGWLNRKRIGIGLLSLLYLLPDELKTAGVSGFDKALVRAGL